MKHYIDCQVSQSVDLLSILKYLKDDLITFDQSIRSHLSSWFFRYAFIWKWGSKPSPIFTLGPRVGRWNGCNQTCSESCISLRPGWLQAGDAVLLCSRYTRYRDKFQGTWSHVEFVERATFCDEWSQITCSPQSKLICPQRRELASTFQKFSLVTTAGSRLHWPRKVPQLLAHNHCYDSRPTHYWGDLPDWMVEGWTENLEVRKKLPETIYIISFHFSLLFLKMD